MPSSPSLPWTVHLLPRIVFKAVHILNDVRSDAMQSQMSATDDCDIDSRFDDTDLVYPEPEEENGVINPVTTKEFQQNRTAFARSRP